jgi:hypothetical protein
MLLKILKIILLVSIILIMSVSFGMAIEIIAPDEIQRGDTGYGISVFKGQTPETFTFEVISVMKNFRPKHDIIIVELIGDTLYYSGVIAGMSGSPVYIKDKLAGAIAYGWPNSKDPIAGVAPIKNMLETLEFPVNREDINNNNNRTQDGGLLSSYSQETLQPLLTPLYVSGIPVEYLHKFKDKFNMKNFYPIQVGSGVSSSVSENIDTNAIFSGGSLGVSLMQGDVNISSIGTITHIDTEQKKVLAFGHPFFNDGFVDFPITSAYIHTVISRNDRSFKLGSALDIVGRLYSDNVSCVSAVLDTYPELIKMNLKIVDGITESESDFSYSLVDNRNWTPYLIFIAYFSGIQTYHQTAGVNAYVETEILFRDGEKLVLDNHLAVDNINEYYYLIMPFFYIYGARVQTPEIKSINAKIILKPDYSRYFIDNILLSKTEFKSGEKVYLTIRLKEDLTDEFIYKNIEFTIPDNIDEGIYHMLVEGGQSIIIRDIIRIDNQKDLINFIKAIPKNDALRVSIMLNQPKLLFNNKSLDNLPINISNIIASYNVNVMPQFIDFDFNLGKVLSGQRRFRIKVTHERF